MIYESNTILTRQAVYVQGNKNIFAIEKQYTLHNLSVSVFSLTYPAC